MTKKHSSIDQLSSASSRRAQSEAAMLQSDLKKLRTSLLNMDRGVRSPTIKSKRTWTKKTTETSFLAELLGGGASGSFQGLSVSLSESSSYNVLEKDPKTGGYVSNSQNANRITESYSASLRIR